MLHKVLVSWTLTITNQQHCQKKIINIDWHYYKKVQLLWKIIFNPKAGSKLDIHESDRDFKCDFRYCHNYGKVMRMMTSKRCNFQMWNS